MRQKVSHSTLNYLSTIFLITMTILSLGSEVLFSILGWTADIDLASTNLKPILGPPQFHWLGTDFLGRDIFSLLIQGAKYSILVSCSAGILGTMLGTLFGSFAGFLGDHELKISYRNIVNALLFVAIIPFYTALGSNLYDGTAFFGFLLGVILGTSLFLLLINILWFKRIRWMKKTMMIPVDLLHMKGVEIFYAIPIYFVLLAFSSFVKASAFTLVLVIGCTSWPQTALLIRSEVLKIRHQDFITSLRLSGIGTWLILIKHIVPNVIRPAMINLTFLCAGLLIIESTLSFVGLGLPGDIISWGKVLAGFKFNTSNWWSAVFPGIVIFITILSFHRIGYWIRHSRKRYGLK